MLFATLYSIGLCTSFAWAADEATKNESSKNENPKSDANASAAKNNANAGSSSTQEKGTGNAVRASREILLDAGHMEIDGGFNRFRLSNGVRLTVHRYRVTADEMTLERTPRGLIVNGSGSVSFCPCVQPPLTVGFTSATVAPPTDLILRNASFRAYGLPVFYLPWFWVRSPNRSGMMSPRLSYRGNDGFFLGTGIHLPLSKRYEPSPEYLDLSFGSYLFSGFDIGGQLVTTNTVTNLRWDRLHHNFVEFDAVGYRTLGDATAVAWRADALRGARARTGYVSFEASSRAYDHSRLEVLHADGQKLFSIGFQNTSFRGLPLREMDRWGPSARVGIGTAIADFGYVDSTTTTYGIVANDSKIQSLTLHSSTIGVDARPGPFAIKSAVHENWMLGSGSLTGHSEGVFGAEARMSLPLVRNYGSSRTPVSHWLEPHLLSTSAWQRIDGGDTVERSYGGIRTAQLGLLNVVGQSRSVTATSLLTRVGFVESPTSSAQQAFAARWLASGTWLAVGGAVGTVQPWNSRSRAWMSTLRGRVGRIDRVSLSANVEGRSTLEPLAVRWLLDEGFRPWLSRWYSAPGVTVGSQLDINLFEQVASMAAVTFDVEQERLLSERFGLAYRHPCGCLAASSVAGWRVGRDGWDVSLLLDLMP
jgi:hypothetical protein